MVFHVLNSARERQGVCTEMASFTRTRSPRLRCGAKVVFVAILYVLVGWALWFPGGAHVHLTAGQLASSIWRAPGRDVDSGCSAWKDEHSQSRGSGDGADRGLEYEDPQLGHPRPSYDESEYRDLPGEEDSVFRADGNEVEGSASPWRLCSWDGAEDYIPCHRNGALAASNGSGGRSSLLPGASDVYSHCRGAEVMSVAQCLVPVPEKYKTPLRWPMSREAVWYHNVPHEQGGYDRDEVSFFSVATRHDDFLAFPFPYFDRRSYKGAHPATYIDLVEKSKPEVAWGNRTRVVLDVGGGAGSLGSYLFDRDAITMSTFALTRASTSYETQIALERGVPAVSTDITTQRLPFPSNVYDLVNCARCAVEWNEDDGRLLLEVDRLLRPGGYFVWSAKAVYKQDTERRQATWATMVSLAASMCWTLQAKATNSKRRFGIAVFQKSSSNEECLQSRASRLQKSEKFAPICTHQDPGPDAAWYTAVQPCIYPVPKLGAARPAAWPARLVAAPAGVDPTDFLEDTMRWAWIVEHTYTRELLIDWAAVRNVMDMGAGYGSFAAALVEHPVWVMNVVDPISSSDTLPVIFQRGLVGIYHDWCLPFSTFPRTYDLVHADHVLSRLQRRCSLEHVVVELDRIMRPGGWLVVRDLHQLLDNKLWPLLESLHWDVVFSFVQEPNMLLAARKTRWRPGM